MEAKQFEYICAFEEVNTVSGKFHDMHLIPATGKIVCRGEINELFIWDPINMRKEQSMTTKEKIWTIEVIQANVAPTTSP